MTCIIVCIVLNHPIYHALCDIFVVELLAEIVFVPASDICGRDSGLVPPHANDAAVSGLWLGMPSMPTKFINLLLHFAHALHMAWR
jgi:hypothetical protein